MLGSAAAPPPHTHTHKHPHTHTSSPLAAKEAEDRRVGLAKKAKTEKAEAPAPAPTRATATAASAGGDVEMRDGGAMPEAVAAPGPASHAGELTGKYELAAVLTHKGRSADSGHYVAWVKQVPAHAPVPLLPLQPFRCLRRPVCLLRPVQRTPTPMPTELPAGRQYGPAPHAALSSPSPCAAPRRRTVSGSSLTTTA
jgi:hypothetical protein